jgi:hypothetical protein
MSRKVQRYNWTFIPAGVPFAPFAVNVHSTYSPALLTDAGQAVRAGFGDILGLADGYGDAVLTGISVANGVAVARAAGEGVGRGITTSVSVETSPDIAQSLHERCTKDESSKSLLPLPPRGFDELKQRGPVTTMVTPGR